MTAATAHILARVFGNSPDFWLNVQQRSDLWEAMHSPRDRKRTGASLNGRFCKIAPGHPIFQLGNSLLYKSG